uniref:Protein kinase domain-containing protein n=1 Tax=Megaselia scalaris TaxID=36166 RepID=T1H1Z3_MEGSC
MLNPLEYHQVKGEKEKKDMLVIWKILIHLVDEFDILQIVGEGWFGKILLVEHRASGTEMVLKAVPKPYVSLRDFYREFHFGLHLGIHRNIVTTYDVAFETAGFYVFTQEYAPLVLYI